MVGMMCISEVSLIFTKPNNCGENIGYKKALPGKEGLFDLPVTDRLFNLKMQYAVFFHKGLQVISHYALAYSCWCAGENNVANV